ncbi:hypothetical protein NTHiID11_04020 [Haemophilus influenzae]|nr:hypothetical protein CHBNII6_08420 [Haemophilus influenzae]GBK80121.1 hypothetical protein NTHiID11_04020 [Haemophilus influenzae]
MRFIPLQTEQQASKNLPSSVYSVTNRITSQQALAFPCLRGKVPEGRKGVTSIALW